MTTTIHQLGDRISALSMLQARQLSGYLKNVHGIEPTASATIVPAREDDEENGDEPQLSIFNVVLTSFSGNRVAIIRTVRAITELGLQESMRAVENLPLTVQESLCADDAQALKSQLEEAGGTVELT